MNYTFSKVHEIYIQTMNFTYFNGIFMKTTYKINILSQLML